MTDKVRPVSNSDTMYHDSASNPARDAENITPSDITTYTPYLRALRVGSAGDVAIVTPRGNTVLFANVQDGETIPCWAYQVNATDTTATNIVGYFG